VLCGSAGLAGSAKIGRFAYIGGMAGVGNQIRVRGHPPGGAPTPVFKDVPPRGGGVGQPFRGHNQNRRGSTTLPPGRGEERAPRRGNHSKGGPSGGESL